MVTRQMRSFNPINEYNVDRPEIGLSLPNVRLGQGMCDGMSLIKVVAKWYKKNKYSKYAVRRLPVLDWLSRYRPTWFLQDALAGITVGLLAVPQGIAYGALAGLNPEYGLYAAFMASFTYIIFGTCKSVTIGPTVIMAIMIYPFVEKYGADMAILITFLKGCIIALLGIFHLGSLLDFISLPVITGFTSAAAINIAFSQFKSLLGIRHTAESFLDSVCAIYKYRNEIRCPDTLLGVDKNQPFLTSSFYKKKAIILYNRKNIPGQRTGTVLQKIGWFLGLFRNTLVVIIGTVMAYIIYINDLEPFMLTGTIGQGLPSIASPPFSTFHNLTYNFLEMTTAMKTTLFTIPVVSTIMHIAVAKAFAKGESLDITQEIIALGACNIFGSFVCSMPVTGSFVRTAINHASGVKTPLGGIFTGSLVLFAIGLLTSTFRFIPKATLAGLVIYSMYYMLDFPTYKLLWRARKIDFFVMKLTLVKGIFLGLEYGILIGIVANLVVLLYFSTHPSIQTKIEQIEGETVIVIVPEEAIAFPAAERLRATVMKVSGESSCNMIILDCKNLKRLDVTVAENIKLLGKDLSVRGQTIVCSNCCENVNAVLKVVAPELLNVKEDRSNHVEGRIAYLTCSSI
ncbi:Sodium-independent sulfate anion transporter [Trachymyrmex cornetzi]|uniref:Sodium-independent sulfate anion transporter n=1 Tax=Trachymyrmex cornetzi TaxID=471704 RepID=A0A195DG12_9HYME|nr:Sodium-independent sulfate anion transporter [Trachymyrmex cornetzi]